MQNDLIGQKTLLNESEIFGEKLKAFTEWWRIPLVFIFGQKFNLAGLSVKITDLRNRQELKITLILKHDLRLISFLDEINAKRRISVDPYTSFFLVYNDVVAKARNMSVKLQKDRFISCIHIYCWKKPKIRKSKKKNIRKKSLVWEHLVFLIDDVDSSQKMFRDKQFSPYMYFF